MFLHIIDRNCAKYLGLKKYYTAKPCKHNHIRERYVSNSVCLGCKELQPRDPEYIKKWKAANPEKSKEASRISREKALAVPSKRAAMLASQKSSYIRHKQKRLDWQKEYIRERRRSNKDTKMMAVIRMMLHRTLRGTGFMKSKKSTDLMGYDSAKLIARLEFQFKPGMNWANHGDWEIDHKISVSRFFKRGETRPHIINALSNLQPLWKAENRAKGSLHV